MDEHGSCARQQLRSLLVCTSDNWQEPLLEALVGDSVFYVFLNTDSSVSLMNAQAFEVPKRSTASIREDRQTLRLAERWLEATSSLH